MTKCIKIYHCRLVCRSFNVGRSGRNPPLLFELRTDTVEPSAGPPGLEPGLAVLETTVLPLNDGPLKTILTQVG